MKEVRLALAVPCCRDWKAAFGSSILGLVRYVSSRGISGINLSWFDMNIMQGASVLPRARQLAVEWAKKSNATHLLFIDDDMQFPANILDRMMENDADVMACNYVSKATGKPVAHGIDGLPVESSGMSGIEEIGWAGFGFILIKLEAIKDIPAPLFETRWLEDRQDFIGEDFYFCGKVRASGVKIMCDHEASQGISHIGDHYHRFQVKPRLAKEVA